MTEQDTRRTLTPSEDAQAPQEPPPPHTALIVDDEQSIREPFAIFLAQDGFSVFTASSFDEALTAAPPETLDLVVVDVTLGGCSGLDLVRALRERGCAAPMVLVTGMPDQRSISEALQEKVFDYLVKPVRRADILRVANRAREFRRLDKARREQQDRDATYRRGLESRVAAGDQELQRRLEIEGLVAHISRLFAFSHDDFEGTVNLSLALIGAFGNFDRGYVVMFEGELDSDDCLLMNTHEWCAVGVEPQIHRLQSVPATLFPWSVERWKRLETVVINAVEELPPEADTERREFEHQNIASLFYVPLIHRGRMVGFFGFDSVGVRRTWKPEDIRLLEVVGDTFSSVLAERWREVGL